MNDKFSMVSLTWELLETSEPNTLSFDSVSPTSVTHRDSTSSFLLGSPSLPDPDHFTLRRRVERPVVVQCSVDAKLLRTLDVLHPPKSTHSSNDDSGLYGRFLRRRPVLVSCRGDLIGCLSTFENLRTSHIGSSRPKTRISFCLRSPMPNFYLSTSNSSQLRLVFSPCGSHLHGSRVVEDLADLRSSRGLRAVGIKIPVAFPSRVPCVCETLYGGSPALIFPKVSRVDSEDDSRSASRPTPTQCATRKGPVKGPPRGSTRRPKNSLCTKVHPGSDVGRSRVP